VEWQVLKGGFKTDAQKKERKKKKEKNVIWLQSRFYISWW
jgi:hypothetical protein